MQKHFYIILIGCMLMGCQIQTITTPVSPSSQTLIQSTTAASPTATTALTQLGDWQVDTVFRGAVYQSYISHFFNEKVGFVVCTNYPDVHKTTDGGKTWIRQTFPIGVTYPNTIDFLDEQTGFITFHDTKDCPSNCRQLQSLVITRDGGQNWAIRQSLERGILSQGHFWSATEGVASMLELSINNPAVQSQVSVVRTADGGKSWQKIAGLTPGGYSTDFFFANRNTGFLRGPDRQLYRTTNAGRNWELTDAVLPGSNGYERLSFFNADFGYTTVNGTFYRTIDGGKSWQVVWQGDSDLIGFVNEREQFVSRVYKVNNYGDVFVVEREIRHTTDGGQTWKTYPSSLRLSVPTIRFFSDKVGFGVYNNTLIRFSRR